ncbi:MAG: TfoX/Sxy family DNA transformation protein [Phycisphaeraceae bacterium]|nr:TfoX/Sxy family DNA transformation protein [Phycisphaerales bacterium]MCB9859393.1 TfoX/Sxy family DNA transformation protein [Phycisphaeraceae bacterium]
MKATTKPASRNLIDLRSVGKATVGDFHLLGITTVEDLAKQDAKTLYDRLCRKTGVQQDMCVLDVFECAIAQAKNPNLPAEQCDWWYWSKQRKAGTSV